MIVKDKLKSWLHKLRQIFYASVTALGVISGDADYRDFRQVEVSFAKATLLLEDKLGCFNSIHSGPVDVCQNDTVVYVSSPSLAFSHLSP